MLRSRIYLGTSETLPVVTAASVHIQLEKILGILVLLPGIDSRFAVRVDLCMPLHAIVSSIRLLVLLLRMLHVHDMSKYCTKYGVYNCNI